MQPCTSCKKDIAKNAKTCPHCGHDIHLAKNQKYYWGCLILMIISMIMVAADF